MICVSIYNCIDTRLYVWVRRLVLRMYGDPTGPRVCFDDMWALALPGRLRVPVPVP